MNTYFKNDKYLNQSLLKLLLISVELYNAYNKEDDFQKLYYKERGPMIKGSAVDTLLTTNDFNNLYYVSVLEKKPTKTIVSIVKQLYDELAAEVANPGLILDTLESINKPVYKSRIISIIEEHNYQGGWKTDTKYNKICKEGENYFKELLLCGDRQLLSVEENNNIEDIVISLKSDVMVRKIIIPNKDYKIYTQKALYQNIMGIPCKGLLDFLKVDKTKKTVSIYDLKIIDDAVYNYPKGSYRRFKHGFQGAFYYLLAGITYIDYKIENPYFIVASSKYPEKSRIFQMSNHQLDRWLYGINSITVQGTWDKEIEDTKQVFPKFASQNGVLWALKRYIWHLANGFEVDKEVFYGVQKID